MAQKADTDDRETIANEQRGCGFLKPSSAYLRSGVPTEDGVLPAFVEFDDYIPYLERSKFRSYEVFPGVQFELSVTGNAADPSLPSPLSPRVPTEDAGFTRTDPPGEIHNHLRRLAGSGRGTHAGEFAAFHVHDLYMHVGASYYETPQEFIDEVKEQGLSKKIPVSESQEPPIINPGLTRLFLVHPKAIDEDDDGEREQSAVIGYCYLTRIVYTEDKKGRYPAWAQKMAKAGLIDLVERGPQVHEDGTVAETLDDLDDPEAVPSEEGETEVLDDYLPGSVMDAVTDVLGGGDPDADPEPYDANAPDEGEDEDGEESFACEYCGKGFDTEMGRRGHLRACPEKPASEDA